MAAEKNGGFLRIKADSIVTPDGKPIILKGAGLGGWMNMENFITGYPAHEYQMRAAVKEVLGQEKYEYFFDKFLEYFFGEDDAKFFAKLGLNCIRLPINYRHFEDDMNPRVFKKEGLKHLDRVIDLCGKYGIYTVIDLHTVPGGQNMDWHADAGLHEAVFWQHKDFQDRAVWLWEQLAAHYKDNTWIAGYNPLNEPTDKEHTRLIAFYDRIVPAIQKVDPNHILFLDGNTFGMDFSHFGKPYPNTAYACHDYSRYGFPLPPGGEAYTGTAEQIEWHKRSFERKIEYMKQHNLPIWCGEWGPVYENPADNPDAGKINESRFQVLELQLKQFREAKAGHSIWLAKDIGFQGMVYCKPDTPYMQRFKDFLAKKKRLAADAWGVDDTPVRSLFEPLEKWMEEEVPSIKTRYPPTWKARKHISRLVRDILLSEELCAEYAEHFRGLDMKELDELAKSFSFENCQQRERLNEALMKDAELTK